MKAFNKLVAGSATAIVLTLTASLGFTAAASADCTQYNPNGTSTSATPIFNNFCGVPGVGDEPDFVRVRANTTGDPTTGDNAAYVDALNNACDNGTKFDVRTYIHNGADPSGNDSGKSVAHNVAVAMNAPLNSTNDSFKFGSTISASNAASVSDTATLHCNNGQTKLTLVPGSVHVYSKSYGWNGLGDGAVNGSTKVGSPVMGSGDQLSCWDFRIVVVYQVTVQKVEKPQVTAQCDMLNIVASEDRKVKVSQFKFTNVNASVKNVVLNWGDNSPSVTLTDTNQVVGQSHQYANNGTFVVTAVVTFAVAGQADITSGGAGTACAQQVTFNENKPPVVVPPTTPPAQPTTLVNTGAGSVAGIFAAATAAGAAGYRYMLGRRLGRQ